MIRTIFVVLTLCFSFNASAQVGMYRDPDGGLAPRVPGCLLIYNNARLNNGQFNACSGDFYSSDWDQCANPIILMEAVTLNVNGEATAGCSANVSYAQINCDVWCKEKGKQGGLCALKRSNTLCSPNGELAGYCHCATDGEPLVDNNIPPPPAIPPAMPTVDDDAYDLPNGVLKIFE